ILITHYTPASEPLSHRWRSDITIVDLLPNITSRLMLNRRLRCLGTLTHCLTNRTEVVRHLSHRRRLFKGTIAGGRCRSPAASFCADRADLAHQIMTALLTGSELGTIVHHITC